MTYQTEVLQVPETGSCDVLVAGGGIAGVAAAMAAARGGAKVLLVEKSIIFGGLATGGLINYYEPLCDGLGRKLVHGIGEELMELSIRYGPDTLPDEWRNAETAAGTKRCATSFSPTMFALALDEWLTEGQVGILLDSVVVKPVMSDTRCEGVMIENKTGRQFVRAKVIIDTTGDADLFTRAGAPCEVGENYMTYSAHIASKEMIAKWDQKNILALRKYNGVGSNLSGIGHPEGMPKLKGITAEDLSYFALTGRKMLLDTLRDDDRFQRDVMALPTMAQIRESRRLIGEYTLTEEDESRRFEDSIGIVGDFWHPGKMFEIPYRCLVHRAYDNLITAGRTISSTGWAWDVTRIIPSAAITGQAAGLAALLAIRQSVPIAEVNIPQLQETLASEGVVMHY